MVKSVKSISEATRNIKGNKQRGCCRVKLRFCISGSNATHSILLAPDLAPIWKEKRNTICEYINAKVLIDECYDHFKWLSNPNDAFHNATPDQNYAQIPLSAI